MTIQDNVFRETEGDAWFRRNSQALASSEADPVSDVLRQLAPPLLSNARSVLDVGCANGWRLARLRGLLPEATEFFGFDASEAAILAGRASAPQLRLEVGLVDQPPFARSFDLVIVSYVLHWIDRSRIAHAIAAIDGLVVPGGLLVVVDFLPDRPCARRYHHREDVEMYTYKQDYPAAFTGLGLYREIARHVILHGGTQQGIAPAPDQERAVCSVLHKPTDAYPLQ